MKKIQEQLNALIKKQQEVDELVPFLVFESGMSFGDLALVHKQRRAGTVLTLTNCFFAVVSADGFHKLIKKNQAAKVSTVI